MNLKFAIARTRSRGSDLTAFLLAKLDWLLSCGISCSANSGRHAEVFHQPDPLSYWLRPYFFIGPANLGRPVRSIRISPGFDADRKRTHHLTGTDTVKRRPVVALAVHHAGGERIAAD